jgi:hypothetical protein
MRSGTARLLGAAGIVAPVLWTATVIYCGAVTPGYDPVNQFISELGARGSRTEYVMRVLGMALPGLLLMLFGASLFGRAGARVAAVLVVIHGTLRVAVGVFPCDAGCPVSGGSFSQVAHSASAALNGLVLPASGVVWARYLRKTGGSRPFAVYSIASALLSLVFAELMIASVSTRHATGLYQRLALGIGSLWLLALAVSTLTVTDRTRRTANWQTR